MSLKVIKNSTSKYFELKEIGEKVEIKNSKIKSLLLFLGFAIFFIFFLFIGIKQGFDFIPILFLILWGGFTSYLLMLLIIRKPIIVIDYDRIFIKDKGSFYWKDINEILIQTELSSSAENTDQDYYLIINVKGKTVKVNLFGLEYNYKTIANFIENFKHKAKY